MKSKLKSYARCLIVTNRLNKIILALWLTLGPLGIHAQTTDAFKFVALGDMPYSIPDDYIRYERLIKAINDISPSFSIFVGDTKSGSSECSDQNNQITKNYFNQFTSPLIYSIGDNEWTDCHRIAAGGYDPLERLSNLRETFFKTKKSFGKTPLELTRQGDIDSKYIKFVENSYWIKNQYLFVNLHIPGSNNNFERDAQSIAEYRERNQANIDWIKHTFAIAAEKNFKAIIFAFQADIFFSPKQFTDEESGYRDTLRTFSQFAEKFKRPVLLIHGDSHKLIIDQPLKTLDRKYTLENVIRLQVMGAEQVQAVEIKVDSKLEQPFSFRPILLQRNRLYPSP